MQSEKKHVTARESALKHLAAAGDSGLSKSDLSRKLDMNPGAYRRLLMSMTDKGEISITEEFSPKWGPTKVVRALRETPVTAGE